MLVCFFMSPGCCCPHFDDLSSKLLNIGGSVHIRFNFFSCSNHIFTVQYWCDPPFNVYRATSFLGTGQLTCSLHVGKELVALTYFCISFHYVFYLNAVLPQYRQQVELWCHGTFSFVCPYLCSESSTSWRAHVWNLYLDTDESLRILYMPLPRIEWYGSDTVPPCFISWLYAFDSFESSTLHLPRHVQYNVKH